MNFPENAYDFNWSLSSGMNIVELGCRCGFSTFQVQKTHFQPQIWSIWPIFPKSAKSLLYKTKKLRNSESGGGSDVNDDNSAAEYLYCTTSEFPVSACFRLSSYWIFLQYHLGGKVWRWTVADLPDRGKNDDQVYELG